jgi:cold shock CspA family protein/uncharacterized LabA/DUF88 family protein
MYRADEKEDRELAKVMVFIDGTWLYSSTPKLANAYGKANFHIDYGKLPKTLGEIVARELGMAEFDIVRTHLFGSSAKNYHPADEDAVQRRRDFFDLLREDFYYEVEVFLTDFKGRRLRRRDRDPNDDFEPEEKCVDVALATAMLYYGAIPNAYDIAIAILGDRDYLPMLQYVRRLGKRVALASIRRACASEYADPLDQARVKDCGIIWLDELLDQIELRYEKRFLACESPSHRGDPKVWTDFVPRKGRAFYCDECRRRRAEQKAAAERQFVARPESAGFTARNNHGTLPGSSAEPAGDFEDASSAPLTPAAAENTPAENTPAENGSPGRLCSSPTGREGQDAAEASVPEGVSAGKVYKLKREGTYGFIQGDDGNQYFFHETDLVGLQYDMITEGLPVAFEIVKLPAGGKAGKAVHVRSEAGVESTARGL